MCDGYEQTDPDGNISAHTHTPDDPSGPLCVQSSQRHRGTEKIQGKKAHIFSNRPTIPNTHQHSLTTTTVQVSVVYFDIYCMYVCI